MDNKPVPNDTIYYGWGCLDHSLVNTTQHIMEKEKEKDPAGFERGF
jgi:hypothetical protein